MNNQIKTIMCCCGQGLGSSMLVRLNTEKVLKNLGITGVQVEHSTIADAVEGAANLFIFGSDLKQFIPNLKSPVILLDNIVDIKELEGKIKTVFNI
ncbi:MAG: PTS sugar transporter subunit IIB [Elusimicrobiota bacterium]|jgi:PTS system ascorbate-specific IIB component|nr:PTS sugar transporter subunit IIB [Elusimicrobiota bacterium]